MLRPSMALRLSVSDRSQRFGLRLRNGAGVIILSIGQVRIEMSNAGGIGWVLQDGREMSIGRGVDGHDAGGIFAEQLAEAFKLSHDQPGIGPAFVLISCWA